MDFDLLDATNLAKPTAGHFHRLQITFQNHDRSAALAATKTAPQRPQRTQSFFFVRFVCG